MSLSSEALSRLRRVVVALTGLLCVVYAGSALLSGRPDPFSPWLPVAAGAGSALLIALAALVAGDRAAAQATDETYRADMGRATGAAFWIALLLYPAFGLAMGQGWVSFDVAFVSMATLTPAAFLLLFAAFDQAGRA